MHTCTLRSPLSSFRGIVGRDGDGFVMRDTSTDESSELTSKTRSCASIKPAIFLASRTRRVDRARWYSMRALISTHVCDKMHRRTRASASCFSMCLHWITDAKIETKEDSSYCSVHGSTRELSARQKVCARRLKCGTGIIRRSRKFVVSFEIFQLDFCQVRVDLSTQTKLLLGEKSRRWRKLLSIKFSHSIFLEEEVSTEFNKESVARDTPYTVFARQTRARAVHMDRICRRRCAHVRDIRMYRCPLLRTFAWELEYARGKDPERIHNARYVALLSTVSVVIFCTSCIIGFVWNSSNSNVGEFSLFAITRNVLRRFSTRSSSNIAIYKYVE